MLKKCIFYWVLLSSFSLFSQSDSIVFLQPSLVKNNSRIIGLSAIETIGYSSVMIGLNTLWYKDYPKSSFHFFNDNKEWLQMDKLGHATTAYYVGYLGMKSMEWTGMKNNRSLIYGGTLGLFFLTSVELFDGYSSAWGASTGDLIANTSGFILLAGQQLAWNEQRILLKYSAHFSEYAQYRPNLLGSSRNEQLLKDYNGQTYWLSVNLASFLLSDTKIPKWLNLAFGYSGEGMLGGFKNPAFDNDGNSLPEFIRYRQYLFSLDVDLTKIKTRFPLVNTILGTFGFVKIPFPALEYNKVDGFKSHLLYF